MSQIIVMIHHNILETDEKPLLLEEKGVILTLYPGGV
jgi:hypothetical protein